MTDLLRILLVEDAPGDVELVKRGLERSRVQHEVQVVGDGAEAMEYLRSAGQGGGLPDLILLDINLPRKSGHEVLAEMSGDTELSRVPVIVLTTSDHDEDVLRAYENRARKYVLKPMRAIDFLDALRGIDEFAFNVVKAAHAI